MKKVTKPLKLNDDIEHIIQLSADKVRQDLYTYDANGWNVNVGYGRVNAKKALDYLRYPYTLNQLSASGGTDYYKGPVHQAIIYGASGLADGAYLVYAHEVRKNVTFNEVEYPHVWGRGVSTNGWSAANPNFSMGFCGVVNGTVTNTSATLYTYVYEVYSTLGQWIGWYPTTPGNTNFAYTVEGIPVTHVSGTISSSTTWDDGYYIVDNDVTVNNGATLTVSPGTIVSFPNSVSLTVNGVLSAVGTSSQPITFTAESGTSPGIWGTIKLNGSGASGSTIKYANISYSDQVEVDNVPDFEISNCNFTDNYIAVYVNNSSGMISNNYLTSNSIGHSILIENASTVNCRKNVIKKTSPHLQRGSGIQFGGGSDGYVWQNDITQCDWGFGAIWGSSPEFYNTVTEVDFRNNRITHCNYGVMVYNNSYPVIGVPYPPYGVSTIYDNDNADVSLNMDGVTNSNMDAVEIYWKNGNPSNAVFLVHSGSTLYTSPYSTIDRWASYPLPSIMQTPENTKGEQEEILAKMQSANNEINAQETSPIMNGINLRHQNKYKEAKGFFISYLAEHPEDQRAYIELYKCYSKETADDLVSFFKNLPSDVSKDHKLLLSYLYLRESRNNSEAEREKFISLAENTNNEIIKENPNTSLSVRAKINNIYIALFSQNNLEKASNIFSEIADKTQLSTERELADVKNEIEIYAGTFKGGGDNSDSPIIQKDNALSETPKEYSLLGNYPNPFNPSTTISYNLPKVSEVEVTIYDILGNKVKSFFIPSQNPGTQKIKWNGRKNNGEQVSSGIYLYHFKAVSFEGKNEVFEKSAKLILMK